MKNLNKEKISDMLMQVDENILDKAFYTDDPDKLNEFVSKENIRKSMTILKTRKSTEQVILILIILPIYTNIQESTSGN